MQIESNGKVFKRNHHKMIANILHGEYVICQKLANDSAASTETKIVNEARTSEILRISSLLSALFKTDNESFNADKFSEYVIDD